MIKKERISPRGLVWLSVAFALSGSAFAESYGTYSVNPTDTDGRVVPGFYPNVELDLGYDDNVLRTQSNKQSSMLVTIKPELQWIGAIRKHLVRIGYQGEYTNYFDQTNDNYRDHFLGGDVTLDLTPKFNVRGGLAYRREHEGRGIAGALNTGARPNRWNQVSGIVEAIYGRREATAQIAASYEYQTRDFTNNGQSIRDFDANIFTLTGYYNLGPKTQLLVEPSLATFTYPNSVQDNDVRKLLVGVTWNATAKTTGVVKVGHYNKDFDAAGVGDQSGLSVDLEVVWEPKTYSTVVFKASRDTNDSVVGGSNSFEATALSVDWEHELTSLTQLQAGASYEQDEYDVGREDDFVSAYLGVSRSVTRNLEVGVRYDFGSRDSTVAGNDYNNNRFTLGVRTTFD